MEFRGRGSCAHDTRATIDQDFVLDLTLDPASQVPA
jgi:hypothetical protein